jgi:hypothetical protein
MSHQLTNALRQSLNARLAASNNTVRAVAAACQVNYKSLWDFSQGELADFGIDDLERLAAYLKLRLTPEAPAPEPPKTAARGSVRQMKR